MIRTLDPRSDRQIVTALMAEAADYFRLWLGRAATEAEVEDFFTAGPPNIDPATACRLGLFSGGRLSGLAEVTFGFPEAYDAYLGLMILSPHARGQGHGRRFLAHVEGIAQARNAPTLFLAVLGANSRGRAFWEREGFADTGIRRCDDSHGLNHTVHRLAKAL